MARNWKSLFPEQQNRSNFDVERSIFFSGLNLTSCFRKKAKIGRCNSAF